MTEPVDHQCDQQSGSWRFCPWCGVLITPVRSVSQNETARSISLVEVGRLVKNGHTFKQIGIQYHLGPSGTQALMQHVQRAWEHQCGPHPKDIPGSGWIREPELIPFEDQPYAARRAAMAWRARCHSVIMKKQWLASLTEEPPCPVWRVI